MNAGNKELLCSNCRKKVSYQLLKRPAKALIKNVEITYEEYYGVCDECKEELYVPGLEDRNEEMVEELYRREKGLITVPEISKILKKYNIEKRPLSKLLGMGELTITRYLDGQLPSKRYSDLLYQILNDDRYMKKMIKDNGQYVSDVTVRKVLNAIESYETLKKIDSEAERFAMYVIGSGREITNLLLQKLLYYIKGISCLFEEKTVISDPCEAWKFGPVFPKIYQKYKDFGNQMIENDLPEEYIETLLTIKERQIADYILDTFGIYNAWFLKDLTHMETPWKNAHEGVNANDICKNVIDDKEISDYFSEMNDLYNLKTPGGIDLYINEMKKKLHKEKM